MWFEKKRRKKKGTQPQPSPNPNRTHFNPAAQHLPETNPKLHAGPTSPVNQSPFSPGPAATSLPQPSPRDIAAQHLPSPRPDSRVRPVPSRVKLTAAQQRPLGPLSARVQRLSRIARRQRSPRPGPLAATPPPSSAWTAHSLRAHLSAQIHQQTTRALPFLDSGPLASDPLRARPLRSFLSSLCH